MNEVIRLTAPVTKHFEGLHKIITRNPTMVVPYVCPAGYWTIGYGTRCPEDHPPITEEQASLLLYRHMADELPKVYAACPPLLSEPPVRVAAVLDWTYNLGLSRLKSSTMRKRINERRWGAAAQEMSKWVWGGGRKLPGLIARREINVAMLLLDETAISSL